MTRIAVSFSPEYHIWETAATDKTRPMLQGVYVDPKGYLVASDGWSMAIVPCKIENGTPDSVLIPAAFLKQVTMKRPDKHQSAILLVVDTKERTVSGMTKDGAMSADLIGGTYPKWRMLVPKLEEGKEDFNDPEHGRVAFDPAMTVRLVKAMGVEFAKVQYGKASGPILLLGLDGAVGVQMPTYTSTGVEPIVEALAAINA